jgi:tight adherence protein C
VRVELLIPALILAAALLLGLAAATLGRPRTARRRLARLTDGGAAGLPDAPRSESTLAGKGSARGVLVRWLSSLGSSASRAEQASVGPLRMRLMHAGYRSDSGVSVYVGSRMVLAIALPLAILATPAAWSLPEWRLAPLLCLASGFGYVIPMLLLSRRVKWRKRKIELALPDALDLMVVCVEAGFGINASLARVSKEFTDSKPILSSEMELVSLEIRAGKSTVEALRGFAVRTAVSEVRSLVALLVQTERFGTSVADALRVHADAMRVRRMQRAEEQAGKAPLKMIFPTVLIFAATIIVLLTPAMMRFNGVFEK